MAHRLGDFIRLNDVDERSAERASKGVRGSGAHRVVLSGVSDRGNSALLEVFWMRSWHVSAFQVV